MGIDSRLLRAGFGGLLVLCACAVLVHVFAGVDLHSIAGALGHAGRLAPLAVLPFMGGMALDAAGMFVLLRTLGRAVPFAKVFPIRVATEALHMTAPAGFVVADTAAAALLDVHCGVPLGEGAVLVVARKWLVTRAHAVYIVLGAAAGTASLAAASGRLLGSRWTGVAVALALALGPLGLSMGLGAGFAQRSALTRVQAAAEKLPWRAVRQRVVRFRAHASAGDGLLSRVGAARAATRLASLAFLGCWLAEAVETAMILWLIGGSFDLRLALAVEIGVSIIRSLGNVAPAGLGIQEAGYATLLTATGVNVDAAAAFVLLKRCKELVWIATGYALLASMRRPDVGPGYAGGLELKAGS